MISLREMVTKVMQDERQELIMRRVAELVFERYPEKLELKVKAKNGNVDAGTKQLLQEVKRTLITNTETFYINKDIKPYTVGLIEHNDIEDEAIEDNEDYESTEGIVYILGTNTFTRNGQEYIKIGFTTQTVDKRISQLYTTGVPFEFRVIKQYQVINYAYLEKALHALLDGYRPNKAREFFTVDCLEYVEKIVQINTEIISSQ